MYRNPLKIKEITENNFEYEFHNHHHILIERNNEILKLTLSNSENSDLCVLNFDIKNNYQLMEYKNKPALNAFVKEALEAFRIKKEGVINNKKNLAEHLKFFDLFLLEEKSQELLTKDKDLIDSIDLEMEKVSKEVLSMSEAINDYTQKQSSLLDYLNYHTEEYSETENEKLFNESKQSSADHFETLKSYKKASVRMQKLKNKKQSNEEMMICAFYGLFSYSKQMRELC